MDVSGDAVEIGHLLRGPDVIDVAVGDQNRGRRKPVVVEDPAQRRGRPLARIDDDGVRAWPGGDDVAVARQHPGGKSDDQHGVQFPIRAFALGGGAALIAAS